MSMVSRLVPSVLVALIALSSAVAEAAPKGDGGQCRDKAITEIDDEDLCEACGGKWVVDDRNCGGNIVLGGIGLVGGLATLNPWAIVAGVVTLGVAVDSCQGQCEAKAG